MFLCGLHCFLLVVGFRLVLNCVAVYVVLVVLLVVSGVLRLIVWFGLRCCCFGA